MLDLLREKDIKIENTTVIFLCSPFQRCIDTAVGIARGLQHAKQTFLRLEPAAGEWMTERFFDEVECTAQQMMQRKIQDIARNHAQISKVLSMDWHYSPIRNEFVYPETMAEMQERFDELRRSLDTMIARDVKANRIGMVQQDMKRRDIVIVLVTHGAGINASLESYKQVRRRHVLTLVLYYFETQANLICFGFRSQHFWRHHIAVSVESDINNRWRMTVTVERKIRL